MPVAVLLSLGSNLGERRVALRRAIDELKPFVTPVRVSPLYETDPVGCLPGSPDFLNVVLLGSTRLSPFDLIRSVLEVEERLGRRRRRRNDPRVIDIDVVLYGAALLRGAALTVPHPRFRLREFVLAPMRELKLPWVDPSTGRALSALRGEGDVRLAGPLY